MKSTIYILFLMVCSVGLVSCSPSLVPGANLSGRDLSNQRLVAIDLSGADLSNANLTGSDLASANLSNANLGGANLSNANLAEADLQGANLTGANLTGAILDRANLSDAQGVTDELLRSAARAVFVRRDSFATIINTMSPACQGIGVPQAAAFTGGAGFHPVILIQASDDPFFHYDVPVQWSPLTIGETQLVACVGHEQKHLVEVCHYTLQSGGAAPSINRFRMIVEIHLVVAQTGETVDDVIAEGPEPRACPSNASLNTTSLDGWHIEEKEINAALAPYVLDGAK